MQSYHPAMYGDRIADIYDEPGQTPQDADEAADFLHRLAMTTADTEPRLLEFGVGTARIALPLGQRGCTVTGVDCSPQMLDKCAAADVEGRIRLIEGDMSTVQAGTETFDVVYAAWNTLLHALTQQAQIETLANAHRHLKPGGHLVVQAYVPDLVSFAGGDQRIRVFDLQDDLADLDVTLHDPVTQTVTTQYLIFRPDRTEFRPLKVRYFWPSELDLMAQLAGLESVSRQSDWIGTPFTRKSTDHVSVYRRPI